MDGLQDRRPARLTSREVREQVLRVNGAEIWVAEQGTGVPCLLCPGGPGLADYLGPVAALIQDVSHVYRFDPRGCGRSSRDPPFDIETLSGDIEAIRLALGVGPWVVGGHSFGADLALAYALEHPDSVRGLLYISGTGLQDDRQWHEAYEAGRAAGRDPVPALPFVLEPDVHRAGLASWRSYLKQPQLLKRVSQLGVPTLAIHGGEDVRPMWPVEQVVHLLPDARLETIPAASHCQWLTHPEELAGRLRSFLTEVGPGSSN